MTLAICHGEGWTEGKFFVRLSLPFQNNRMFQSNVDLILVVTAKLPFQNLMTKRFFRASVTSSFFSFSLSETETFLAVFL
jgi:hypothetical protein